VRALPLLLAVALGCGGAHPRRPQASDAGGDGGRSDGGADVDAGRDAAPDGGDAGDGGVPPSDPCPDLFAQDLFPTFEVEIDDLEWAAMEAEQAAGCGAPKPYHPLLSFAYGDAPVLDGADLELRRGEVVVLEGPNGCGKTTLAKLAAGLLDPRAGTVERVGRACYLSQDPGRYLVRETALDEVALGASGDRGRARAALERVGLGWAAGRHPRDLSSGERERLGLAAVAVSEPDLLVLDEPTRGVDPDRAADLGVWLAEYAAAGRAVLVATHDRGFPAHRRVSLEAEREVAVAA